VALARVLNLPTTGETERRRVTEAIERTARSMLLRLGGPPPDPSIRPTRRRSRELPVTRCAVCRTQIAPTSLKRVVNGESYHAGCWDRKVRQEDEKKPAR
jgi:hypothetical protein